MKKLIILALLAVIGTASLFSQQETWFSTGFEFGGSLEHTENGTTYFGSPGFNLNGYGFSDKKDIGVFFHYSFLFPLLAGGDGDIKDYDMQWEFIFGPGFRYSFSENLKLQFGAGVAWMPIFASYNQDESGVSTDFSKTVFNLGIGADIGIKYDITDYFYINGGLTVSYLFFNRTHIYSTRRISNDETSRTRIYDGRIKEYGIFSVKPYISVGFNYYSTGKTVWGKPKD